MVLLLRAAEAHGVVPHDQGVARLVLLLLDLLVQLQRCLIVSDLICQVDRGSRVKLIQIRLSRGDLMITVMSGFF